jgi:S-methylmethionine-dependent homocysteine/selenocysteine methylase
MKPLPQLSGDRVYLTDGGLETTLIFHRGLDLPHFAAYTLLADDAGRAELSDYFGRYLAIARDQGAGFILDTATWRANPDWGERLGDDAAALDRVNRAAVGFARAIAASPAAADVPVLVNGVVGPRGDGYVAGEMLSPEQAFEYHAPQLGSLAAAGADMVSAITMTHVGEAIGIARAAAAADLPVVISFTVETDGRLPTGQTLGEAIAETDFETSHAPAYFMVNCAHPTHFAAEVARGGSWVGRIAGLRANASTLSHAELDAADELDSGDPDRFGEEHAALAGELRNVCVLGGCCGTDERHVAAVAAAWSDARV